MAQKKSNQKDSETIDNSNLPLFYKDPVLLSKKDHATWGLKAKHNFRFASKTNAIPVTAAEFHKASAFYPIVFSPTEPMAMIIVGLRDAENLFVAEEGKWEYHTYIPLYAARYPFTYYDDPQSSRFLLCVDAASDLVSKDGTGAAFIEQDEPSKVVQNAIEVCNVFQSFFNETRDLTEALIAHDLLVDNSMEAKVEGIGEFGMRGFRIVDEEKFNKLPDNVFLEWRQKGWLAPIYAHLMSMARWAALIDRTATKVAGEQKKAS